MLAVSNSNKIYYTLRVACAMCFIGHGAFGVITKEIWCNYFAVAGIDHATSYKLMPVVGTVDIVMGIVMLLYPARAVAMWLVIWGAATALCRPLSGEPFAEFIERAGNYGAPLALLLLCGAFTKTNKGVFSTLQPVPNPSAKAMAQVTVCLRIVVFLLLAGHGWLNLIEKKALITQYTTLGFDNPLTVAHAVGLFELFAAVTVLVKPARPVLMAFFIWKAGTELFYPHWELFEWIERGGSYGAILALYFATKKITLPVPTGGYEITAY